ncbi:MAG: hypothetical protein RBT63_03815 [Bdellovibrionales bacterium]|nr:hypothetical protein [Bdellovibrionales bacterium]
MISSHLAMPLAIAISSALVLLPTNFAFAQAALAPEDCPPSLNQALNPGRLDIIQQFSCELVRHDEQCSRFKLKEEDARKCTKDASSDTMTAVSAAVNCGALTLAAGTSTLGALRPGFIARLSPSLLAGLGRFATGLNLVAIPFTAYSLGSFAYEALEVQQQCYENVELKRNVLEAQKRLQKLAIEKMRPHLPESELRLLVFPEAYLTQDFIDQLPCSRLNEILEAQRKKLDPAIGKLMARGLLKTDPRKDLPINEEQREILSELAAIYPCLSAARQADIVCAAGNIALFGKALTDTGHMSSIRTAAREAAPPHVAKLPETKTTTAAAPRVVETPALLNYSAIQRPKFDGLKQDLPDIKDPVKFVEDFENTRRLWNAQHPNNLNNFPVPNMHEGAKEMRLLLSRIDRPPQNRLAAQKIIQELNELEAKGYPYRDSVHGIYEASALIAMRHPRPFTVFYDSKRLTDFADELPPEVGSRVRNLAQKYRLYEEAPDDFVHTKPHFSIYMNEVSKFQKEAMEEIKKFYATPAGQSFRKKLDPDSENGRIFGDADLSTFERTYIKREISLQELRQDILRKDRSDNDEVLRNEILIPTRRSQSIEGLAESYMVGISPIEITERARFADGFWMSSRNFLDHDIAHIVVARDNPFNKRILNLPLQERMNILRDLDQLPSQRSRDLARFTLFQTNHEFGDQSQFSRARASLGHVRDEYKNVTGSEISRAEAEWMLKWFQETVTRRIDGAVPR